MTEIWSNTDFPYMCLKDEPRTLAFRRAVEQVVRPGDRVVDIGSGTGIMAFFAAAAGAAEVVAVEIEPTLASCIEASAARNGLADRVRVVRSDAAEAELPSGADVVIAELIDTALLDEQQVPVLNALRASGVIGEHTRVIPGRYRTVLQLVQTDNAYYGFEILAPKHEWPFYAVPGAGWLPTSFAAASDEVVVAEYDFEQGPVEPGHDAMVTFGLDGRPANAVRIAGVLTLADGVVLGATNALNGDKYLAIEPVSGVDKAEYRVRFTMGGGLGSFRMDRLPGT
jgi:SAM-dependent methyltransferase